MTHDMLNDLQRELARQYTAREISTEQFEATSEDIALLRRTVY